MKYYELTCLASPVLSEEELKSLQDDLLSEIKAGEGMVAGEPVLFKKKLAYPIKKEGWAFLLALAFYLTPEKLEILKNKLKSRNDVLRYLVLTKTPREIKKTLRRHIRIRPFGAKEAGPGKELPETERIKEKIELKEIDKKLEEILGE